MTLLIWMKSLDDEDMEFLAKKFRNLPYILNKNNPKLNPMRIPKIGKTLWVRKRKKT
jgi:hypothetical protein